MSTSDLARKHRAAAAFLERGWHLILIGPSRKPMRNCDLCRDAKDNEHYVPHGGVEDCPHEPETCHGWQAGTLDPARVHRLLETNPTANLGVVTSLSRLVVIDLDVNKKGADPPEAYRGMLGINDGWDAFAAVLQRYEQRWPDDTLTLDTPSGGLHLWWTLPAGLTVTSSSEGKFAWLVDVRAQGSYVPAPGARTREGEYKRWAGVMDPPPAPGWLLSHLKATGHFPEVEKPRRPYNFTPKPGAAADGEERLGRIADALVTAPDHTGHAALCTATMAAAHLVADGIVDESRAHDVILGAGRARNRTDPEIKSAWRTALAKAGTGAGR